MVVDRYVQFQTQTTFVGESFDAFGANDHRLDVSGEDITGDHQYIYPATVTGRTKRDRITGPKKFSGPIDCPIFSVGATSLLYYGLGKLTTVANTPTTNLNTHTITKAKTIPFFRAGIGRDLKEHQYVGGMIGGFTLDWDPNELFTGTFDTVFRKELSPLGTLNTTTSGFFPEFSKLERAFGGSEVATLVDGSDQGDCFESISVEIDNSIADDAYCLGSPYLSAGVIAGLEVTGSFDLVYEASTMYTRWLDGTEIQLELNAAHDVGDAALERKVDVDLPKISMDVNKLPTDNIERYVQTVDFTAETDTNGDPIIVKVVNAEENAKIAG
jgi:hypothetical protein